MSRAQYVVKQSYTGTGSLDSYTFDFKIESKSHLLVVVLDDTGAEVQRVRGTDLVFLSDVTFDAVDGGGTVTLQANLTADYVIIFLLANDEPLQEYEFRNKTSFTLRRFEAALDAILGAVQRLAFRSKQAFRIHDADDESAFDTQLPPGIANQAGRVFAINSTADGVEFGPTITEISNAQTYSVAASTAQGFAEDAQTAAENAALAAASAASSANDALIALQASIPTFVEFNGPISGSLSRNEIGIIRSGVSFALTLDNTDLALGDVIEVKFLGFTGNLTVAPTGANIDGVASKILMGSTNASYKFRYTGTEWIIT